MCDKDVVETKSVGSEGNIATSLAFQISVAIKCRLPNSSAGGIGNEQGISVLVEGEALDKGRLGRPR